MKHIFVILPLIIQSQLQAQDKLFLINGDSIICKIIKISGISVTYKDDYNIDREVNNFFVQRILAGNKEVPSKQYFFRNHTKILDEKTLSTDGHSVIVGHSLELEQEANATFPNATKRTEYYITNDESLDTEKSRINWICYLTNPFLVLKGEDGAIAYSKPIADLSFLFGKKYSFDEVFSKGGSVTSLIQESKKPGSDKFLFEQGKYTDLNDNSTGKFDIINDKIIFYTKKGRPKTYQVVYYDDKIVRINQLQALNDVAKTMRLIEDY
jgi:hypothetical protein